jgi:cystathionine beta-lyase
VSPDDCSLALRGLQTLGIRLERLESSALKIAHWLKDRPEIETVLHPALPGSPGHDLWKRDFTGSASVFSFVFAPRVDAGEVPAFVDRLSLFRKGFSWGGTASLAMLFPDLRRPNRDYAGRLVRLNIGLEEPDDLIEDLAAALAAIR